MGAPLLSDKLMPSWRRWERAWLDSPLRVSNRAPHTSHFRLWTAKEARTVDE